MAILDLGCGWGSLGLFLASKYPKSKLTLLSNSNGQREFIMGKAKERGLTNVQVYTGDIAVFQREDFKERFDRVMSVGAYPRIFDSKIRSSMSFADC